MFAPGMEKKRYLKYTCSMNVIVIGNGGREHAISWKLSQSPEIEKIVCVPGNGGSAKENKCKNVDFTDCGYIKNDGTSPYVQIAKYENCEMAVIGPEEPLAAGLADEFIRAGIECVGASKAAAKLEASKDYAKSFMQKYGVECAASKSFTDEDEACEYVKMHGTPIVIKADGLAGGKGVIVAASEKDAIDAVHEIMKSDRLGNAGKKIVIEDYLEGIEVSVLSAVSVTKNCVEQNKAAIVPFLYARDHKRLLDGAKGPNTGGMGAVCPLDDVSAETMKLFDSNILEPTLRGIIEEGYEYCGFLFFGVMITKDGPKLLEYNVRLGDPETQAVLPLMDFDFFKMCRAITGGTLKDFNFCWKKGYQVAPVIVSGGYPEHYHTGKTVFIDENKTAKSGAKIFIAGAKIGSRACDKESALVTSGGRVLACSAFGKTFEEAYKNAYSAVDAVKFEGAFYRTDIGLPGAAESGKL